MNYGDEYLDVKASEAKDILDPFCSDEWMDTKEGFSEQWGLLEKVIDNE
jgi:hypothetical protein